MPMLKTNMPFVVRVMLVLLLLLGCAPLSAQSRNHQRVLTWPVDSILARFDRDTRANAVPSLGSHMVFDIIDLPGAYAARRDSLLDGLERLALGSDHRRVRAIAADMIAFAGTSGRPSVPLPGVMRRLVRLYHAQPDAGVRSAITNSLPEQAERRAAAALLRAIASGPDPHGEFRVDDMGDDRVEALHRLSEMGEEGRAVLQAMHRSGEARSPWARALLDQMARRGFPVRDIRRRRP